MPVYGYRCSRGHHFEVHQRITDAPLNRCPECDSPATRVFYPVGIIFKGGGFYKTDSRGSQTETASGKTESPKVETSTEPGASGKESAPPPPPAKEEKQTT